MSSTRSASILAALAALALAGTALATIAAPAPNRTISLRNIHTDETISVEYKRGASYVPAAMEKINWVLRDWRKNEPTKMDPRLVDLLWEMHAELGSQVPINVISGYRSPATNAMLRRTVGGQASKSQHMQGKAADVQFPDIPIRQLRYSAMIREQGGVGYYPTSATPFVHVDTDRVRAWPRMQRHELALLFPGGRTQHQPASGGPLTLADVREARAGNPELTQHVAAYHSLRTSPRPVLVATAPEPAAKPAAAKPAVVAALTPPPPPPAPKLVAEPRLVDRPSRLAPRPSEEERQKLTQLATLAALPDLVMPPRPATRPRSSETAAEPAPAPAQRESLGGGTPPLELPRDVEGLKSGGLLASIGDALARVAGAFGWSTGPEFDEDHPEEVSYRPFPIAPYLTDTPSPDDPALVSLVHPDAARTLELLDSDGAAPPMKLRPGTQVAELMWAQRFDSRALAVAQREGAAAASGLANRAVRTAREK